MPGRTGFSRWQIVNVGMQGTATRSPDRSRRVVVRKDLSYTGGGILIAAVVAWTLWFLWLLAS